MTARGSWVYNPRERISDNSQKNSHKLKESYSIIETRVWIHVGDWCLLLTVSATSAALTSFGEILRKWLVQKHEKSRFLRFIEEYFVLKIVKSGFDVFDRFYSGCFLIMERIELGRAMLRAPQLRYGLAKAPWDDKTLLLHNKAVGNKSPQGFLQSLNQCRRWFSFLLILGLQGCLLFVLHHSVP